MTLRARLTGAFLAVVLGPVLVGGIFVGATVSAEDHSREHDRLNLATSNVRTMISASCDRLESAAEAAAAGPESIRASLAQSLVNQGRASAIHIDNADGTALITTTGGPPSPWALCTALPTYAGVADDPKSAGPYRALAAAVAILDQHGTLVGYAYAAQALTAGYAAQVASGAGVQVTLLSRRIPVASTQNPTDAARIATFAARLKSGAIGADHGQYVQRIDPGPAQPFTVAVSVPAMAPGGMVAVLVAVVAFTALAALAGAWVLARTTTRPLDEITEAAARIVDGDLGTRVPVRHDDEVGHLGAAFNRLSRDIQSYMTALVNSRDQLRGNLDLIGDTLASTHDLPKVLHVILAAAMSAGSATSGVVLLLDPTDGRLRLQCAEGFDGPTMTSLRGLEVELGAGILGSVAASGAARRGRMPVGKDTGPVAAPNEPPCRSYLAVAMRSPLAPADPPSPAGAAPLSAPTASAAPAVKPYGVGVLALYDRLGSDEFDEADLATVRSFASHAAVAVDNVRAHAEAQRLSHTDPLTGLYNYRHLKDLLRRELNRAARFGHPLCVLVLDLDRFKEVNDSYGHAAGNAVLIEFARRIGIEIRGVDLAFRYGGEEFVLLLPETDGRGGMALAQRLGEAVRDEPFTIPGGRAEPGVPADAGDTRIDAVDAVDAVDARADAGDTTRIPISVSIGVAVYPDQGSSASQVLDAADDALYVAKAAGRDTCRLSTVRLSSMPGLMSPAVAAQVPDQAEPSSMTGDRTAITEIDRVGVAARAAGAVDSDGNAGHWADSGRGRRDGSRPGGTVGGSSGGGSGGTQPPRQSRGR